MRISLNPSLTRILPCFHVCAYTMDIMLQENPDLKAEIAHEAEMIQKRYLLKDILAIPAIKAGRDGYKLLGKDPSRYRLAAESLFRRIVKKRGLSYINNVVDCANLLSLKLARATAVFDLDKIKGDITIRIGSKDDVYCGIGRGLLNVANIPLYCDALGPFGSPTSDTYRTSVTAFTHRILFMVICFATKDCGKIKDLSLSLFQKYCGAKNICEIKDY